MTVSLNNFVLRQAIPDSKLAKNHEVFMNEDVCTNQSTIGKISSSGTK